MNFYSRNIEFLNKNYNLRKVIVVFLDIFIWFLSFNCLLIFKKGDLNSNYPINIYWILYLGIILGTIFYKVSGQYKALTRYASSIDFYSILIRNLLLCLVISSIGYIFNFDIPELAFWFLLIILISGFSFVFRFFLRDVIIFFSNNPKYKLKKVVIYGSGDAGAQLANALSISKKYKIVAFVDDAKHLIGRTINGITIKSPSSLSEIKQGIDQVLLAIPSLTVKRRKIILENLEKDLFNVMQIPSLEDLTNGNAKIDSLRPVSTQDLLGREIVKQNVELYYEMINNKVVCVSGAGGSIGSELCRQIIKLNPKKLILIEINEHSLYRINNELIEKVAKDVEIVPVLENVANYNSLKDLFERVKVNLIFHAAAYKHVPLVEINPLSGLSNNIYSTNNLCKLAIENKVDRIILISSDKAVRPSNVMGLSKRLSELIFQAYAQNQINRTDIKNIKKTIFAMVRFGNVLGSSGSVVPLFNKQISSGGPLTLTHKDVIRFFMTISESVHLVLQAASFAKGGDVFILDMGKPVKIYDLAIKMINLSGLSIRNSDNPNGDIEIIFTGLRPGEKLYEELLIDAKAEKTQNSLILRAEEGFLKPEELFPKLDKLKFFIDKRSYGEIWELLKEIVPEWSQSSNLK